MYVVVFLTFTIICCVMSLIKNRQGLSAPKVIDILLFYLLLINVGLTGLWAFIGHTFFAEQVAASIGWAQGSPFQWEVAAANLAFGILGVLCVFFKNGFWLATGIGNSVFLFGAAFVHIREIITADNTAINNAGPVLYIGDIAIPLLILALLFMKWRKNRQPDRRPLV